MVIQGNKTAVKKPKNKKENKLVFSYNGINVAYGLGNCEKRSVNRTIVRTSYINVYPEHLAVWGRVMVKNLSVDITVFSVLATRVIKIVKYAKQLNWQEKVFEKSKIIQRLVFEGRVNI